MDLGFFLPTATRGFLVSTTSPPFDPTFDNLLKIVARAEEGGIDFALSMVKLHGFGGPSGYWNSSLDSFTLVAGLLARTQKIKVFASVPILALPPAMCARASSTIDLIAPGRFGLNMVTGWQKAEYDTMGLWPGEEHFKRRYDLAGEYMTILQDLFATGRCTFDGEFYQMRDCEVFPKPRNKIDIVCAGQSDPGMRFACDRGDYIFLPITDVNKPETVQQPTERLEKIGGEVGKKAGCYALAVVCADETREAAQAKWAQYSEGLDTQALGWASGQASLDTKAASIKGAASRFVSAKDEPTTAVSMSMGALIGSYGEVAAMLDVMAETQGVAGIMIALCDWEKDVDTFCRYVEPAMKSRADRRR